MTLAPKPTVEMVRAYRDQNECGTYEAKAALMKEWKRSQLYALRLRSGEMYSVEACQNVIQDLLELLMESEQ